MTGLEATGLGSVAGVAVFSSPKRPSGRGLLPGPRHTYIDKVLEVTPGIYIYISYRLTDLAMSPVVLNVGDGGLRGLDISTRA